MFTPEELKELERKWKEAHPLEAEFFPFKLVVDHGERCYRNGYLDAIKSVRKALGIK